MNVADIELGKFLNRNFDLLAVVAAVTSTIEEFVLAARFRFSHDTLHTEIRYLDLETFGRRWRVERLVAPIPAFFHSRLSARFDRVVRYFTSPV